jgi:hypothetical protein
MVLKCWHPVISALLLFASAGIFGCEDNPDECYSNRDCPNGCICKPTYYTSGERSGGYCEVPDGAQCTAKTDASDGAPAEAASDSSGSGGSTGTTDTSTSSTGGNGGQSNAGTGTGGAGGAQTADAG